jgi:hypothetical protein
MFKGYPASFQTFIDTPICVLEDRNSNYVIMVNDWNCLKYFYMFLFCNYQVKRNLFDYPVVPDTA